jgi:TonB family protein
MIRLSKGKLGMPTKKILLLSILISLASHMAVLALTGLINMQGKSPGEDVMTVQLKEYQEDIAQPTETKGKNKPATQPAQESDNHGKRIKEETVDLGSIDVKYTPYLKKIKEKIETIWTYPKSAYRKEEEGITVIKFSINKKGSLVSSGILTSSGSIFLDQGTIDVVRSAAPYDPLPPEFDLSQLNIVATFHYKLAE